MPDTVAVDAVFAKANLLLAQQQDLVASWLVGGTENYPGATKTDTELEEEEKGIFTLEPEL